MMALWEINNILDTPQPSDEHQVSDLMGVELPGMENPLLNYNDRDSTGNDQHAAGRWHYKACVELGQT